MSFRSRHQADEPAMNLTPMIDVLFLLVIFFLFASKFRDNEGRIAVNVPGIQQLRPLARTPDEHTVTLSPDGRVALDGVEVNRSQLASRLVELKRNYPDMQVVLRADRAASWALGTEICELCQRAGVARVGIATQAQRR
jgi:biopolymer transport protein ExbD